MADGDVVHLDFQFGEWFKAADGNVAHELMLFAQAGVASGSVVTRLAVAKDRAHVDAVAAGKAQLVVIQLRPFSTELARRFGAQLIAVSDRADGMVPRGVDVAMADDGRLAIVVATGDGQTVIPVPRDTLAELHRRIGQLLSSD